MADISKIQVPGSTTQYNIKDAQARRDIEDVKADLGAQTGVISLIKNYYIKTLDTPIDLTPMPSTAGRMYAVVDCTAGDKFVINAYSDFNDARTWCFIDNSNNAISMAGANAAVTDLELTAPTNAVKLIINDKSGGMSYKVGNNLVSRVSDLDAKVLNNDIKAALINAVSHIGAWTDGDGREYIDALKVALNYDFYNIAYRSLSNGSLSIRQGGADITTVIPGYAPAVVEWNASYPRYSVYVPKGIEEVYAKGTADHVQGIYPIPVPENKRNATIAITPSGQYFACVEFSHNGTEYQRVKDNGWKTSGTTIALQETTSFIMVNIKYDNEGRSYPTPPTNVKIEFTD